MQRSRLHVEGEDLLTRPDPNHQNGRQSHPIPNKSEKEKEKEVHVHIRPRKARSPSPVNVTRVVHHSSKGKKEIVYRTPAKPGKDGKIGKGEKKVVHVHHHRRNETKEVASEPRPRAGIWLY